MSRTRLGLFDTEKEYVQRLGAYIMLNERESIEAHLYSEIEKLILNLDCLDAILVPEDFEDLDGDPKVLKLVERKEPGATNQILKYQKASTMLSEVKRIFSISDSYTEDKVRRIMCIASPVKHELQMLYTLCLSKEMSINEKVLYINFCENSGFSSLFQNGEERTLEDLLSTIGDSSFCIEDYVQNNQGVNFIAPASRPELLWEVDITLLDIFISSLQSSSFDVIVIDIGGFFPAYYHLLEMCDELVLLGKEGFLSDYSKKEFLDNLKLHLGEEFLDKVKEVTLPLNSMGIWESEFLLDDLFRGNLGEFVRKGLNRNEESC